jgi:TonB-linked SusC/RagA family outer membrane protein
MKRKKHLPAIRRLKGLFILLISFSFTNALFAQDPIKGRVIDKLGKPVPAATVSVKGKESTNTTLTSEDGSFSIVASPGEVLRVSSVGFTALEFTIKANESPNIVLQTDDSSLEDVVVVGYGTQKKATLTGAISTIKSDDIVRTPAVANTAALVGKIPGITTRAQDARPGNGTRLQIRNLGNPLYVIDGVPYSTNDGNTGFGLNTGVSGQNLFNNLGIEDIESITILKDASASIYGLRASNGVVLVTTKKGKKGEATSINLTGYYGLQNFTRYPKPANAGQYVRGQLEHAQNINTPASDIALIYTPEDLAKWEAGTEKGYKSYDYYDIVLRPNVPQYYASANVSGGSQRSQYYLALSHTSQDALIRDYTFERTNLQANLSGSVIKGLTVGTEISARIEKRHNVGVPGLDDYFNPLLSISSMWPIEPPYANDNPNYINTGHSVNINPATYKDEVTGYIDQWYRSININLNATYQFKWGLSIKGLYSYNYLNDDFDGFEYTYDSYTYNPVNDTYNVTGGNQNPWREKHKRNVFSRFSQVQANYSKQLGNHNISGVAAYERSDNVNENFVVHTIPPNNYIPTMQFANQDLLIDEWSVEARAGYIGRINYSFANKYLVELLGRYDGSFLYEADDRWGFFPGIALGWRITEERFMENKVGRWLSDLKLRASYGETGSEVGLSAFDYLPGYIFGGGGANDGRSAVLDGVYNIGLRPRGLPITNLSWVTNRTKNIGIDFSLWGGVIQGQFDVFERKRTGLPAARYDVLLPSEVGYFLPNENLNSDATQGFDGMITYNGKAGKVDFSIAFNTTVARTKALDRYKPRVGNSWDQYRNTGESVNRWASVNFGYQVVGRFESQEDIDNHPINNDGQGNRSMLPGDFIYKDVNGDGIINAMDERPIGYAEGALPYFNYGINLNGTYKGFTLSIDFSGAGMQTFFRDLELRYPFQNSGNAPHYMLQDRWHRENPYDPNSAWVPGTYPATRKNSSTTHSVYRRNDFWVTNVRYLRCRNLELGYQFPANWVRKAGLSRFRMFVNATNLFSLDNVKEYEIDPEVANSNGLIYPQQKLFLVGFNLSL